MPADEQQRSRQRRRTRDPQPDKPVVLVGTKRQATVVRPDTGEEAAVVAVCATCHWPYWSQRWSHCVNCEAKRDEITKPGPKIWDPKKVQVHYGAGKKAEPKAAARAKARPAPPAVQGRFAESRPATTTGRAAMFSMDADEAEEENGSKEITSSLSLLLIEPKRVLVSSN